jgi:hypothetical protein
VRADQCTQGLGVGAGVRSTVHAARGAAGDPRSGGSAERIPVEIRRGGTTVQAELPLDTRSAAWLREVLG